jgi:integrase
MSDMPRPRPPHLQRRVSRHGKVVWYVRIGRGPLIRISGVFGTPEFDAAYQAAVRGEKVATERVHHAKDTLGWLVDLYLASKTGWGGLSKTTRERRLPQLKQILKTSGSYHLSSVDRQGLIAGRDKRTAPSQARTFVMTMRSLFAWAVDNHLIVDNPTIGIKIQNIKTDGHIPWTEENLRKYEARWPRGTAERVMLDVFAYTGLRRGDAARVGKQHVKDGVITIKTEKTGMVVSIPILPELQATLAAGPIGDMTFNVGRYGLQLTARGLGKKFGAACRAAGLVGRSAHGLRKAAADRAVENGATGAQLNAIFGWTGSQMASLYTEKADRAAMARQAMNKLGRNENETSMLPPNDKVVAPEPKRQRKQR